MIYNSISCKCFYRIGDMLIGSKIPPQADIIKFVIAGGDPRVAGCGAVCQAKMGHRKVGVQRRNLGEDECSGRVLISERFS